MRSTHRRSSRYATVAAVALFGGAIGLPAASAAVVDPAPIGPHQYFTGEVNGASVNAVIKLACPGPVGIGQTGHPLAGQTVDVLPAASSSAAGVGYTGESADSVRVDFGGATTTAPLVLTSYAVKAAIPTSLNLPCSGTGTVAFVPAPTSTTASPALVKVTYANIAL
ncbi:hypothetical protein [Actinacidiphila acididurans]|uniref:Secreted protein n=1 Tax=Actinacidiphila acididurans TaxID=2784346 RepID=A0ABS2TSB1_9ACTN|nr:hypothetical protein [Actinacidiphila acididurans]MBM9506209.1 hypothetical protein [Actinacidiphila acididurans]